MRVKCGQSDQKNRTCTTQLKPNVCKVKQHTLLHRDKQSQSNRRTTNIKTNSPFAPKLPKIKHITHSKVVRRSVKPVTLTTLITSLLKSKSVITFCCQPRQVLWKKVADTKLKFGPSIFDSQTGGFKAKLKAIAFRLQAVEFKTPVSAFGSSKDKRCSAYFLLCRSIKRGSWC